MILRIRIRATTDQSLAEEHTQSAGNTSEATIPFDVRHQSLSDATAASIASIIKNLPTKCHQELVPFLTPPTFAQVDPVDQWAQGMEGLNELRQIRKEILHKLARPEDISDYTILRTDGER
jgi:hypothetical protein